MENIIVILDIISTLGFTAALFLSFLVHKDVIDPPARFFLSLCFLIYVFVGVSNILEHGRITDYLDSYEDYVEILFIPSFLYFLYSFLSREEISKLKKAEEKILVAKHDWEDTFNSITDMVTIHDKDWNIILANKAAEKILKLPILEKVQETKCFRYYHGTEGPPPGCPSCDCLKTGIPAIFELFEPHLNMFIEIRAIPRFDNNNNLIGLIHVVRDITERMKAEDERNKLLAEITTAKKEWEITFDNAMEIIVLVDKELNILRCNKKLAELIDREMDKIPGNRLYDIFPITDEETRHLISEMVYREEPTEWLEMTALDRWFYISHQPIRNPNGIFVFSVIIATDFTLIKNSQKRLLQSEEELKQRVTDLERFYDMSVGREIKMKELKTEIKRLNAEIEKHKRQG